MEVTALRSGFYVVRRATYRRTRLTSDRLIVESRPFERKEEADRWGDWIKSQHPKDAVHVIEIREPVRG